jgi:hypothetical protein
MYRRLVCVLALSVALVGCGGDSPVAFGSAGKPLLERLRNYVEQKNAKDIDRVVELAKGNMEKGNMSLNERDAVIKICDYIKAGDWDSAKKLVDACLTETGKSLGPGN